MTCNYSGECCAAKARGPLAAVAGLALLNASRKQTGLGFLAWEDGGGWWDDLTPEEYDWLFDTYGGGGGGDFWGFSDPFWGFEDVPDVGLVDAQESEKGGEPQNDAWQLLSDWWNSFLPSNGGGRTSNTPALPGYCPVGTYHPLDDPFSCVPFPIDPNTGRQRPRRTAQRQQQQQQAKKPAQKTSPQNPQPCPAPGQTDPRTGKCVCPKGYIYDANKRQCVQATLNNRLVAPVGATGIPFWMWLLGGVLIGGALMSGKSETTYTMRRRRL